MKFLAPRGTRIFLLCWMVFAIHFATNVVREHYPAFSLVEEGNLELDEYHSYDENGVPDRQSAFHPDIFWHEPKEHAYPGNQITGSLPAVIPLAIFDPVLDEIERIEKERLAEAPPAADAGYETEYANRARFVGLLRERGLLNRFAVAAALTSTFCMAPFCALLVVLMYRLLLRRGLNRSRATGLAFLFAFATPVFYRAAHLNHNVFLTMAIFVSFVLLWSDDEDVDLPAWRLLGAGFAAGIGLALDYAGVISLLVFWAFWLVRRARVAGFAPAFGKSLYYVLGSIPPVFFLCWTQFAMYGNWFLPGQKHMPEVNYTDEGWRGFSWPDPELFLANLISLDWGLLPFAPLLVFAFWPGFLYRRASLLVPRPERLVIFIYALIFLLFCAANRYSWMQFNTGFRYLMPLVPLFFLLAAEHLKRLPGMLLWLIGLVCAANVWVLSMSRYTWNISGEEHRRIPELWDRFENVAAHAVPECWRRIAVDGLQLPWLETIRSSIADESHPVHWRILPFALFLMAGLKAHFVWRAGARHEAPEQAPVDAEAGPLPVETRPDPGA